jgi:hypothetical protein
MNSIVSTLCKKPVFTMTEFVMGNVMTGTLCYYMGVESHKMKKNTNSHYFGTIRSLPTPVGPKISPSGSKNTPKPSKPLKK